jgi:hypothetical protein
MELMWKKIEIEEKKAQLIKENLKKFEGNGGDEELTVPLAVLNKEFKEAYIKKIGEFTKQSREELNHNALIYQRKPETRIRVNEYNKEYRKRDYVKKKKI